MATAKAKSSPKPKSGKQVSKKTGAKAPAKKEAVGKEALEFRGPNGEYISRDDIEDFLDMRKALASNYLYEQLNKELDKLLRETYLTPENTRLFAEMMKHFSTALEVSEKLIKSAGEAEGNKSSRTYQRYDHNIPYFGGDLARYISSLNSEIRLKNQKVGIDIRLFRFILYHCSTDAIDAVESKYKWKIQESNINFKNLKSSVNRMVNIENILAKLVSLGFNVSEIVPTGDKPFSTPKSNKNKDGTPIFYTCLKPEDEGKAKK